MDYIDQKSFKHQSPRTLSPQTLFYTHSLPLACLGHLFLSKNIIVFPDERTKIKHGFLTKLLVLHLKGISLE